MNSFLQFLLAYVAGAVLTYIGFEVFDSLRARPPKYNSAKDRLNDLIERHKLDK